MTVYFSDESPDRHKEQDFTDFINEDSFKQITAQVEPSLVNLKPGTNIQFQRLGYFVVDTDSTEITLFSIKRLVFAIPGPRRSNSNQKRPQHSWPLALLKQVFFLFPHFVLSLLHQFDYLP